MKTIAHGPNQTLTYVIQTYDDGYASIQSSVGGDVILLNKEQVAELKRALNEGFTNESQSE